MAKMNRSNVLLGSGTAAAGSGIVFGSGAFPQVEAERDLNIAVDADSDALVELNAGEEIDTVEEDDDGRLNIDSDLIGDDSGFNVDAEIEIGSTDETDFGVGDVDDGEDEAFNIQSSFDDDIDLTVALSAVDTDDDTTLTLVLTRLDVVATERQDA